ncbi:MAG: YfhO family protein [Anaerolineae bacterium]|nr:YfhO family protein [Anaerolineae bacterium]
MTNKWLHLPAVLLIVALTLLFFWKILLTNLILSGVDVFLYFYPYKAYTAELLRQGRLPLWNPDLFMGVPLLANSQVGVFYPFNWLFIWLDAPRQIAWSIGLHIALAGIFMAAFTRQALRMAWSASLIAAMLFAFGGYLGAQVEHINQLQAAAWLPLLFLFYDFTLHRPRRRLWLLLLASTIALVLLAGHAQTVFISMFGLGLYALWQALFEPDITPPRKKPSNVIANYSSFIIHHSSFIFRRLWPILLASLLAVALAAVQLLPTAELSGLSIRSEGLTYREAVSFSLRPTNLHYSLLPPFDLDLSQPLGQAFSEWVAYLGISGLILALIGSLTALWRPAPRRFMFLAAAGLILSLGLFTGPLYLALYYVVPGFDLFRVPARWLLLYAFAAAVLSGYGFDALLAPQILRVHLIPIWAWLRARPWRFILPAAPIFFLVALIIWKTPPLTTLAAWLLLTLITATLIYFIISTAPAANAPTLQRASAQRPGALSYLLTLLTALLILELFLAAQTLNYNQPTAPQAFSSIRNATAFLLAADPPHQPTPPGRFLSLSGITYDPGDLADLRAIFGDYLSERALYDLIVATKEKEVLFFNLPMLYHLQSIDGYDGGILPLKQFITLQELFLPADDRSIDGRLREKLRLVPDSRLLSLLNTRWIITDKQFDVWIDGIFYDLQFPARLGPDQTISTTDIPDFPPTALGVVSHLEGGAKLPDGSPVARITVTYADSRQETIELQAGRDTAEGSYASLPNVAHRQARVGVTWPYEAAGVDYISVYPLSPIAPIIEISVVGLLSEGEFILRGLSLIHQPTTTSRSIILSTEGDYRQVHSGDVKVYENKTVLPRVFAVHRAEIVADEAAAIERMKSPAFEPATTLVRVAGSGETPGSQISGTASTRDQVAIVSYAPERVEVKAQLETPGWVVLTDTNYPGWQAVLDGQPVEIETANILFRAVAVPAGEHTLVFEFKPASLWWGALVTLLALLGVGLGLIAHLFSSPHRQHQESPLTTDD